MINQQITDYIKQQLQQGISREQISSSLLANGWQTQDIEESFAAVNFPASSEQNPASGFSSKKFEHQSKNTASWKKRKRSDIILLFPLEGLKI